MAMNVQAVLSATDAAQLTTCAGTTLPTVAEFLAETLAPLGEMTRALTQGATTLTRADLGYFRVITSIWRRPDAISLNVQTISDVG